MSHLRLAGDAGVRAAMTAPIAGVTFPWHDPGAPDPVAALRAARAGHGDRFWVSSGPDRYLFVFGADDLRAFYALAERDASKGVADYRMLLRKLPEELFADRRTFAHDLFGASDVETYLDDLDAVIETQLATMGEGGEFEIFEWSRAVGHRLALACWCGRDAPFDVIVPAMDGLDGAEAFVRPAAVAARATKERERAALAVVTGAVRALLARTDRPPSFLDTVAARWDDIDDTDARAAGIAGDVVLLHVATMTNLFAALGWTLASWLLHRDTVLARAAPMEHVALEAIRTGQRSIMLREVLRPLTFAGESLERGTYVATMLPLTNESLPGFDPSRWHDRALHHDVGITTFGHGVHRCPATRFSTTAIVRTVERLQRAYDLTARFGALEPLAGQIGGMARAAAPCTVGYVRRNAATTPAP